VLARDNAAILDHIGINGDTARSASMRLASSRRPTARRSSIAPKTVSDLPLAISQPIPGHLLCES
jgi:hypothetical protein